MGLLLSSPPASLGVILFSFYLIYDTQLIIGGKTYQLTIDDYVYGALALYLDVVNMFVFILMILGGTGDGCCF